MLRVFILLWITLCPLLAGAITPSASMDPIETALTALMEALNTHNGDFVVPYLSDSYVVSPGIPKSCNRDVLCQVAQQYRGQVTGYRIDSRTQLGDSTIVMVSWSTHERTKSCRFVFDQDGRFLQIGLFAAHTAAGPSSEATAVTDIPRQMIVPFECREGLVVIDGMLDGRRGKWVVDSGAPDLVINAVQGRTASDSTSVLYGQGIGGAIQGAGMVHVDSLRWGAWKMTARDAIRIDLSHLQVAAGDSLLGLIGYKCLEPFEIKIDYSLCQMTFWALDAKGKPLVKPNLPRPKDKVHFKLQDHLITLPANIGHKKYSFGLDTGATTNLIDIALRDDVAPHFQTASQDTMFGADKDTLVVETGTVDEMRVHRTHIRGMLTVFSDGSGINGNNVKLNGLLGYEFLKMQPVLINYRKRVLWLF